MSPLEILLRIVIGLLAIGTLQAASAWLAQLVRERTLDPSNEWAKWFARYT